MGPLKQIKDLPDDFLVMNGDVLTDLNYSEFFMYHQSHKNIFTISAIQREDRNEYGILEVDEKNILVDFKEKPVSRYLVSMGIYMINKQILTHIPERQYFGFDHLMYALLDKDLRPAVNIFRGRWLDIGRPDDYAKAIDEINTHTYF